MALGWGDAAKGLAAVMGIGSLFGDSNNMTKEQKELLRQQAKAADLFTRMTESRFNTESQYMAPMMDAIFQNANAKMGAPRSLMWGRGIFEPNLQARESQNMVLPEGAWEVRDSDLEWDDEEDPYIPVDDPGGSWRRGLPPGSVPIGGDLTADVGGAWREGIDTVGDALDTAADTVGGAWRGVQDIPEELADTLGGAWRGASEIPGGIADTVGGAWRGAQDIPEEALDVLGGAWRGVQDIPENLSDFTDRLGEGAGYAWDALSGMDVPDFTDRLGQGAGYAWDALSDLPGETLDALSNIPGYVLNGVDGLDRVVQGLGEVPGYVQAGVEGLIPSATEENKIRDRYRDERADIINPKDGTPGSVYDTPRDPMNTGGVDVTGVQPRDGGMSRESPNAIESLVNAAVDAWNGDFLDPTSGLVLSEQEKEGFKEDLWNWAIDNENWPNDAEPYHPIRRVIFNAGPDGFMDLAVFVNDTFGKSFMDLDPKIQDRVANLFLEGGTEAVVRDISSNLGGSTFGPGAGIREIQ